MVKHALLLLIFLLSSPLSLAAELLASVDRKEIGRSDAVTLEVRYDDMAGFSAPDWRVLDREWDVVSKNQSQKISFNNGQNSSYTEWTLTLVPRRSGELLIPAIEFKGAKSDPIRIKVSTQANTKATNSDLFYFEVEVSSGKHYVQEQLLYIERLYYTVNHDDANLSEFTVAGAQVQMLMDPKQYVTVIDGKRIGVYERRYAIFPEKAGTIVIPGQRFSARIPNRYDRFRGTTESVMSKPVELTIHPIPGNFPQAPWIPASKFEISEDFSLTSDEWRVGEAVTRTMKIRATGLNKGQIPPIPMPDIAGLRYYPDQTQDDTQVTEQGMVSDIVQSVALVPTEAGPLTLPEIRIPWWNTLTNTLEYAVLPSRTVQVAAAAPQPAQTPLQDTTTDMAPAADTSLKGELSTVSLPELSWTNPWILLVTGLLLTNLVTLIALFRRKRVQTNEAKPSKDSPLTSTADLASGDWASFKSACKKNDPAEIRRALMSWAEAECPNRIQSLDDIAGWLSDDALAMALAELDATLFSGRTNSAYNGQTLLHRLEAARKQHRNKQPDDSRLPAFYS